MDEDFEHYMVEKKKADTQLVLTALEWVIVRPSALTSDPCSGIVALGLAKVHRKISRDNVGDTLSELMTQPGIWRVILELTGRSTPVTENLEVQTEEFSDRSALATLESIKEGKSTLLACSTLAPALSAK